MNYLKAPFFASTANSSARTHYTSAKKSLLLVCHGFGYTRKMKFPLDGRAAVGSAWIGFEIAEQPVVIYTPETH